MPDARKSTIPVSSITVNLARMVRSGQDEATIAEYARLDKEGVELPRLKVFKVPGSSPVEYILVDGDSRMEAWVRNGKKELPVEIYDGTPGDAVLAAAAANAEHGRPRSGADKRKAIKLLLEQPEHAKKTSREIARLAGGLSHHLVEEIRAEAGGEKAETRINKKGKAVKAKTGKKKAPALFDFKGPTVSLERLLETVDDVTDVFPEEKGKADHKAVKKAGEEFYDRFERWALKLSKQAS